MLPAVIHTAAFADQVVQAGVFCLPLEEVCTFCFCDEDWGALAYIKTKLKPVNCIHNLTLLGEIFFYKELKPHRRVFS